MIGFSHRLNLIQGRKSGFCIYSTSPEGASPAATHSVCVKGGDCHRDSRCPSLASLLSSLVLAVEVTTAVMVFHNYRVLCARWCSKHFTCIRSFNFHNNPIQGLSSSPSPLDGQETQAQGGREPYPRCRASKKQWLQVCGEHSLSPLNHDASVSRLPQLRKLRWKRGKLSNGARQVKTPKGRGLHVILSPGFFNSTVWPEVESDNII